MKSNLRSKQVCIWLLTAVSLVVVLAAVPARADGPSFLESYADPSNARHIIAVFDFASPTGICILQSTNAGATWFMVPAPDGAAVCKLGRQQLGDFFVRQSKGTDKTLAIIYSEPNNLFRAAADFRWMKLTKPPGQSQQLVPTIDPQRFFLIVSAGQGSALYFTDSGGQSWTKRGQELPFRCSLYGCNVIGSSDGQIILYRAFAGDGYMSKDGGWTWQPQPAERVAKEFSSLSPSSTSVIKGTPAQVRAALDALHKPLMKSSGLEL